MTAVCDAPFGPLSWLLATSSHLTVPNHGPTDVQFSDLPRFFSESRPAHYRPPVFLSEDSLPCTALCFCAPCGLRGCKNGPDPFPGRMSYKVTKPGLAVCHILACFFYCVVFTRAPFYVLLVFIVCVLSFGCSC